MDGRNPTPVGRWFIPLFTGFQPSKVVQDFCHQQYQRDIPRGFSLKPIGFPFWKTSTRNHWRIAPRFDEHIFLKWVWINTY